mmetsp:Transcript_6754/g.16527  ORF Transcript_6754/g.16527 Transcript_6754/m.16527 type:complete len:561 (+) Transcript_6754:376-2058(+)|eukprot:g17079.t1
MSTATQAFREAAMTVGHRAETGKVIYPIDSVAFLGAGMNIGQSLKGLEVGPSAIRAAHLASLVKKLGYTWHDYGDLNFEDLFHDLNLIDEHELNQAADSGITKENFDKWRENARQKMTFGDWLKDEGFLKSTGSSSQMTTASETEDEMTPSSTSGGTEDFGTSGATPTASPTSRGGGGGPVKLTSASPDKDNKMSTIGGGGDDRDGGRLQHVGSKKKNKVDQQHHQPHRPASNKQKPIKNLDLIGPACEHLYREILNAHSGLRKTISKSSSQASNAPSPPPGGGAVVEATDLDSSVGIPVMNGVGALSAGRVLSKTKASSTRKFQLTVGGDHTIACPTIAAMSQIYPDLCVIWIDAHGDCNNPKTSPSGHYHGMPAAHVMGWFDQHPKGFETWMPNSDPRQPIIDPRNFCFIGLRDIDPGEAELMRNSDLHYFTMRDVDEVGVSNVIKEALRRIDPNSRRPIHLSFDIDGCDPGIAPGTGTCARGGLTYREAHFICEELALTRRLVSMDLVEINPVLDGLEQGRKMHGDMDHAMGRYVSPTVRLGTELVLSALGQATMYR